MSTDRNSDLDTLREIAFRRRSARTYLPEPIPDALLRACVEVAIRAPSSHNLELWQFMDVRDPPTRQKLNALCLNQAPAVEAPTLIAVIVRPDRWRDSRRQILERLARDAASGPGDAAYRKWLPLLQRKYRLLIPLLFADGPWHVLAPIKWLAMSVWALGTPMMRGPFGRSEKELWAVKSAALACENLMLALSAAGLDSCAMEGFDEPRVKRLLNLPRAARVVMIIAAGRRGADAIIPQLRFDFDHYYRVV
jgi:nitroreductase